MYKYVQVYGFLPFQSPLAISRVGYCRYGADM